ncbi:MAG: tyrosine-type recombinase/integrase [Anaerolineales bacterium]
MAPTILESINSYIESVTLARSENTARTYQNAMEAFRATLADHGYPTTSTEITELSEDAIAWFAADMKVFAPATERLYLTAATGFYEYLVAERLAELNLPRVRLLIRQRARRPGQRLPQFYKEEIVKILNYANNLADRPNEDDRERLRNLRDRAFLITLADSGLRVHEACKLRRGDIDWREGKAIIIGKGNRQDIIRFSRRSMRAIQDYLKATPHSFRHYFVTTVLQGSGNLKLAQELARHRNIQVTQRYAHLADDELDRGYWEIFEN